MPLKIGLVDDQTLVREGLRKLLDYAPEVEVVVEADSGQRALDLLETVTVDVLLLDVRMPGVDGVSVVERLQAIGRLPPTLMLTTYNDDEAMWRSLRAGARGFVLKDISLTQLLADIQQVASGGTVIRASRPLPVASAESEPTVLPPVAGLTERERELLRLMVGGYSNRELALLTGLKEGTVKNYVSSILIKLGARDRTRAVFLALDQGLL